MKLNCRNWVLRIGLILWGVLVVTTGFSNQAAAAIVGSPFGACGGVQGAPNCHGKTISCLAHTYGGINNAASTLNYSSVEDLQNAVRTYCGN